MDEFPAIAAVGEVGDAQRGMEIMGEYTSGDDLVHMCYAFDLLSAEAPTAARYASVLNRFAAAAPDGWACWAYSNHDVIRHSTRLGLPEEGYKALLWMLLGAAGIGLHLPKKSLACRKQILPLKTCKTPMALNSGQNLKAVMAAGRQWFGPVTNLLADSLTLSHGCQFPTIIRRKL